MKFSFMSILLFFNLKTRNIGLPSSEKIVRRYKAWFYYKPLEICFHQIPLFLFLHDHLLSMLLCLCQNKDLQLSLLHIEDPMVALGTEINICEKSF